MRGWPAVCFIAAIVSQPTAAASPPPTSRAAGATALDPQRLALAREIASAFWPDGTMQRMMSQMSGVQSGMMKGVFDKTPKDFGINDAKEPDKTLGQLIREEDPYFEERMAISNRVMMEEIGKLMGDFEPQMREALAKLYARRFTLAELSDMATFFRTSSGKRFGAQLIPMMADPDYVSAMTEVMPRLMKAMPGIAEKVKKATAHLPPPPKHDDKAKTTDVPTA